MSHALDASAGDESVEQVARDAQLLHALGRKTGDYARRHKPQYGVYPRFYLFAHSVVNFFFRLTCKWEVTGMQRLPWRFRARIDPFGAHHRQERYLAEPVVFAVKHTSIRDIFVLGLRLHMPLAWLVKASLGQVPGLGWMFIHLSGVFVLRPGRNQELEQLAHGKRDLFGRRKRFRFGLLGPDALDNLAEMVRAGYPAVVFAEGTRSDPLRVTGISTGALRLAVVTGCKIAPVGIAGTGSRKRGALVKRWVIRRRAKVVIGPLIDPMQFLAPHRSADDPIVLMAPFRECVREAIEAATREAHDLLRAL